MLDEPHDLVGDFTNVSSLQRLRDLELLEHIARDVTSTLDLDRVLTLILERVKGALQADAASVMLIDPASNALVFRAVSSSNAERILQRRIPPGRGIAGWVAQHNAPLVVNDPASDPRFYNEIDRIEGFVTRSILAVPLAIQDRQLGVVEAINKVDGGFEPDDVRLLMLVANWAAVAIENANLYAEANQRAKELAVRNDISQILTAAKDLQGLLDEVTVHLVSIARARTCWIVLGDPVDQHTGPMSCWFDGRRIPADNPHLAGAMAALRGEIRATEPQIVDDLSLLDVATPQADRCPARALMTVPLLVGQGLQGTVLFGHPEPGHFTQADVERVLPVAQQVSLAVHKAQITEHLSELVEARASELRHEQSRLRTIHQVDQASVSSLDPGTLLRAAASQIREAYGYQRVRLWMGHHNALTLAADVGGPTAGPSLEVQITNDSLPGWVAAQECSLYVPDLAAESAPRTPIGDGARSALGLPLVAQQDLVGVLEIHSQSVAAFGAEDVSALETIASRLAMALKNARLFDEVARSQREWATTFDSIAEGVVVHDDNLMIIRANRALAALLETTPNDLTGRNVVQALCGDDEIEGATLHHQPCGPLNIEIIEPLHGRSLAITGYALTRADGSPGGRVLVVRDVTAERVWRARMLQTEKLASLGQLSAGIAHEINNPLGFIHSNLTTLARYAVNLRGAVTAYRETFAGDPRLAACEAGRDIDYLLQDVESAVTESQEGVERVQAIVTGLKNFARAEHSQETKPNDLHQVLEGALKIAWNEIKYKATVEKDYGVLPEVNCNQYRMGQVFINLLVNAAQAIDDGNGRITLRTRSFDDWVEISIQDTGRGVPAENLPRLFDPFFTTKEIGEGTGLGLSVVYGIVHEHGGQIDVASRAGQGTTFTIYLPVAGPTPAAVAAAEIEADAHER